MGAPSKLHAVGDIVRQRIYRSAGEFLANSAREMKVLAVSKRNG
jgi:hypothetical protein